ncbi:MAG TPA: hypothetical protein VFT37_04370 [Telluria sp.]|nr:hypothetical protein [Telluria sp.]
MKSLIIIASLATLAGCATDRYAGYGQPSDPRQWRTVSVTNVDLPPDAPRPDNYTSVPVDPATYGNSVTYRSGGYAPVYSYGSGVYAPPVVVTQPYYNQPQISLGLGFGIGRHGWLGLNQTWGGYPHVYAPYSFWPYRPYYRPVPRYVVPRHHSPRHHFPRHRDGRR